jgi:hypothetical protein
MLDRRLGKVSLSRRILWSIIAVFLSLRGEGTLVGQGTDANSSQTTSLKPGIEGILNAFQRSPIVGLADWHGLAQEEDFYAQLVSDPRFSKEVGNVVVEFGGAAQQSTINRYVAGEDIPYEKLRAVWTDTVGWLPTVANVGYLNVFAQIREVNKRLPASEQIHVWLGEPPIDWSKIQTRSDLTAMAERDHYPAQLIRSEILAKHKKALVIYGAIHFSGHDKLRFLVEQSYPQSFFVVMPYHGYPRKADSVALEQNIQSWREQSASSIPAVGPVLLVGQSFIAGADALLYLGPAASLTQSPMTPDLYLDENFRREIDRRSMILTGSPLRVGIPPTSPTFLSK